MERPVLRHKVKNGKIYARAVLPSYTKRDEGGGFVYLVRAKGFHGPLSIIRKRDKIGLTNNPERRLKELNSEQAPCEIEGVRYIEVNNNSEVEAELHKKFARNRVHGEWFDYWVWELPFVHFAFDCYIVPMAPFRLAMKVGAIAAFVGITAGLTFTYWSSSKPLELKPVSTKVVPAKSSAYSVNRIQKVPRHH